MYGGTSFAASTIARGDSGVSSLFQDISTRRHGRFYDSPSEIRRERIRSGGSTARHFGFSPRRALPQNSRTSSRSAANLRGESLPARFSSPTPFPSFQLRPIIGITIVRRLGSPFTRNTLIRVISLVAAYFCLERAVASSILGKYVC